MKKLATFCLGLLLVGVWTASCTTVVVKEDRGPEVLLPGELVESIDANTALVKCTGVGPDQKTAIDQARRGCLEWMITNQLAQTPSERQAYLASQKQVMANLDRYVNLPPPGTASGKGKGVKSQVRVSDNEIRIVIITDVHKKQLADDLVGMGIVKSTDEMLEGVANPTLIALPSKASKGNKYQGIMEGLVNNYLTTNQFEVLDAKGVEDLNKMVDAIGEVSGAEEDEAAKIAMAVGADVYFIYEAKKEKGKPPMVENVAYVVTVKAYETTTARMLGQANSQSGARATMVAGQESAALQEAVSDAMGKVLPIVTAYWKKDAPQGNRFYVVFKNAPKNTDMKMQGVLKKACSQVKLDRSTKSEVVFRVQCKSDNLELAAAIDDGISSKMSGQEYEFAAKNRNNLIVVFSR